MSPFSFSHDSLAAGCDEAGRGALVGVVVAAALLLPPTYNLKGLNDSKQLSPRKRSFLLAKIKQVALGWGIGEATPREIAQYNILQATFLAMHRAIAQLLTKCRPNKILVDGNNFLSYPNLPHQCVVGGDQQVASIAGASILAKTHRDGLLSRLADHYPGYGWEHNKGYPTKSHRQAIAALGLTPHHRKTFKGCQ